MRWTGAKPKPCSAWMESQPCRCTPRHGRRSVLWPGSTTNMRRSRQNGAFASACSRPPRTSGWSCGNCRSGPDRVGAAPVGRPGEGRHLHCKVHVNSPGPLRGYDVCADRRWATRATTARARKKSGVDPLQTTGAYAGSAFNFSPSALTVGRSSCNLQLARNVVSQQETSSPGGSLVGIRASPFLLTVRRSV